jgi:sugar lactone lactonase YvrE
MNNNNRKNCLVRLGRLCLRPARLRLAWFGIVVGFWSMTAPAQSTYEPYTFTTVAGLAGASGSTDGTGSTARFNQPAGIAVDSAGNVYVADTLNSTIRKVTPAGVVTTLAGRAGSSGNADGTRNLAQFNRPYGVAVDSAGNVYVADSANDTIRKVTPAGVVTTLAGYAGFGASIDGTGAQAWFNGPYGVAADSAGNVFVADNRNSTIRQVTPAGVVTTLAGQAESRGSADGTGSTARFNGPTSVAVDRAGNLYVADNGNYTIRKITPAGVVTTLAGMVGSRGSDDGTGTSARFTSPQGVAVDNSGNLYVADDQTIRTVTPAGVVSTMAGQVLSPGSTDGDGNAVRFNNPVGVAVDSGGMLYVADMSNDTIRKGWPARLGALAIVLGPASQAVLSATNVTFTVLATGTFLHFQWLRDGTAIPGETNSSLTLTNVLATQLCLYAVMVSNRAGTITSPAASLTVVEQHPSEAELRAALQVGGLIKWKQDGFMALHDTLPIAHDVVLDGSGHAVTISGQNQMRVFAVMPKVHLTLLNLTVADGLSDQGGGLYNKGGTVILSNCVFTLNQAVGDYTNRLDARGGAICSLGGSVAATNCLFVTNAAVRGRVSVPWAQQTIPPSIDSLGIEARGGAVAIQDGGLSLANCQFTANRASGGIYLVDSFSSGIKAGAFGGAVFLANSAASASGCRFDRNLVQSPERVVFDQYDNGADVLGGAICQEGNPMLELQNCIFVANQAQGGAGFLNGRNGDARGGAISSSGNLVADHSLFQSNACFGSADSKAKGGDAFGGALFTMNTAMLNHCLFSANWAYAGSGGYVLNGGANGGAVYAQGALQVLNTTFVSNWVAGPQVFVVTPFPPDPGTDAGGAVFSGAVCVATNSTWFQNRAEAQTKRYGDGRLYSEGGVGGAAIYSSNSLTLVNCTIASNAIISAANTAAAITIETNAVAQLSSCLLSGNLQGNLAGSIVDHGFNLSSDHSVLLSATGSRNDVDPKLGDFGDHGGGVPTLALLPGSPAIDAITSGPCPDTDQRGVPRPIGAGCDIGAFEFESVPAPILSLDLSGMFRVQEVLQPASDYQIDVSTNLIDWTLFSTIRTGNLGILKFTDTTVTNVPYQFYRVTPKG